MRDGSALPLPSGSTLPTPIRFAPVPRLTRLLALNRLFGADVVAYRSPAALFLVCVEPCLPTLGHSVPDGPLWVREIKHDSYRFICRHDGDLVRVVSLARLDRPGSLEAALQ